MHTPVRVEYVAETSPLKDKPDTQPREDRRPPHLHESKLWLYQPYREPFQNGWLASVGRTSVGRAMTKTSERPESRSVQVFVAELSLSTRTEPNAWIAVAVGSNRHTFSSVAGRS